jgi:ABC-2 type transport system ATP-binding protein
MPVAESPVVQVRGLVCTFRAGRGAAVHAVRGLDFDIGAGEIVGFLGPNGAGKTSTLRMLTTLLRPTAGSAQVAGADLLRDPAAVRRRIGYVPQGGSTDPGCTVAEELRFQASAYRMERATARVRIEELCEQLDLAGVADRRVGSLSGGQRRRLDVALGLVHRPAVLFLDEPTTGLDPHSRANLLEHIRRLRTDFDTAVLLTTHYLDEADALADRILVIDGGRLIAEDTAEGLKSRISGDVVTVEVAEDARPTVPIVSAVPQVREVTVLGEHTLRLAMDHGDQGVADLVTALVAAGSTVRSLRLVPASLEDAFLALTGRALRDEHR